MDGLSVDWGSGGPWLPAYGLIGDGGLFLPPQCALLETILEEEDECEDGESCSDDCSSGEDEEEGESCSSSGSPGNDGNHSDWGGWGGSSASDAQSVIHIEPDSDFNSLPGDELNDSGSERDFVCPAKRRRCMFEPPPYYASLDPVQSAYNSGCCQSDDDARSFTSLSRSSSLLQFESLERQLLQQSNDSIQQCGIDLTDGLLPSGIEKEQNNIVDSTSESSDSELSDATVHSKIDDRLAPLHEVTKVIQQRSAENLSEDSGYCDGTCNFVKLAKSKSIPCFSKYGAVNFNAYNATIKRSVDFAGQFGAEGRYRRRCRSFEDVSIESDVSTRVLNIDTTHERVRKSTTAKSMSEAKSTTSSKARNKRAGISLSSPCLLKAFADFNFGRVLRSSSRRRDFNRQLDRLQLLDNTYKRLHEEENNGYLLEDSVKVCSVPEDLNLCGDDVKYDWTLFSSTNDSVAAKNFDLYDFNDRSAASNTSGRSNAFTTSCADLTALDYADNRRMKVSSFVSSKMSTPKRPVATPRTHKTLFDEISENFNKNVSILTDREINSTYAVPTNTSKATFDVDPTNLVTCYAESLERCTFSIDSYDESSCSSRSADKKQQFSDSAMFFHSTPTKREFVVSTPNLNSAIAEESLKQKVCKEELRASMQHVPIKDEPAKQGILGSKNQSTTSVGTGKGVHFCPIVSEVSWRERSYSEDTQKSDSSTQSSSDSEEEPLYQNISKCDSKSRERAPSPRPQTIYQQQQQQLNSIANAAIITKSHVTPTIRDYKSVTEDPCFVLIRQPDIPPNHSSASRTGTDESRTRPMASVLSTTPQERSITNETSARAVHVSANDSAETDAKSVNKKRTKMDTNTVTAKMTTAFRKPVKKPGFLARLSSFRFSTRKKNNDNTKNNKTSDAQINNKTQQVLNAKQENVLAESDYIYIPLKGPDVTDQIECQQNARDSEPPLGKGVVVSSKPPLPRQPPRIVGVCAKRSKTEQAHNKYDNNSPRNVIDPITTVRLETSLDDEHGLSRRTMARMVGLIETDLDTHETVVCNGKARSLIDLGETQSRHNHNHNLSLANQQTAQNSEPPRPHKSMEFLLDKENQREALPPENELQKTSSASMSEHQLRVQRSLQRLDLPDWYRQSQVPREGFLLRKRSSPDCEGRPSANRWTGLNSKTTSLNSLGGGYRTKDGTNVMHQGAGGANCTNTSVASSGGFLLSPSTHRDFCRWSTSKLNSSQTSPSSSVRSSFSSRTTGPVITSAGSNSLRGSFRQPYMGWRSQEKLSRPRTPAERLAISMPQQQQQQKQLQDQKHQHNNNNNIILDAQTPEIQSSIKEVTSAIVHYVSDAHSRLQQGANDSSKLPPPGGRSRSASPSQRFCWLESSFVGTRPLDSPQTPTMAKTFEESTSRRDSGLKLELRRPERLNNVNIMDASPAGSLEPSTTPGSASLEDVLASLLGLRPSSAASTSHHVQHAPPGPLPAGTPDV